MKDAHSSNIHEVIQKVKRPISSLSDLPNREGRIAKAVQVERIAKQAKLHEGMQAITTLTALDDGESSLQAKASTQ
jgi:hypothetical protein